MRYPWHRLDVPWADAVMDTRNEARIGPFPDTLPDPVSGRDLEVDGWRLVPHVLRGGKSGESTSVLMLHAPDGWCGAIVLTQYSGASFAFGLLGRTVPYLARLMSPGNATPRHLDPIRRLAAAGFPMLRTAMMNPAGWDPEGEQYADILLSDEMGEMNRYILNWASSNVAAVDASVLEDHQMRPLDTNYAGRKDLRTWHEQGWTDAHDVALWLEADCRTPAEAHEMSSHGLSAQDAYEWTHTPVPPAAAPSITRDFIDAGWTAAGVRHLSGQVAADTTGWVTLHDRVAKWMRILPARTASAYLSAGWRYEEVVDALACGEVPDAEALAFLAALQDVPSWRLSPSQVGVYRPLQVATI
jgi:hypothetical protein